MKKLANLIFLISTVLLFAVPVSTEAAAFVAQYPATIVPSILGLTYVAINKTIQVYQTPYVLHAVEVEIWTDYIADNLFRGVEWLKNCFRADQYVLSGKVVHIPQPGSKPTVVKNRTTIPATAVKRNDTDVTYALDEYTTDPTVIEDAASVQLSYDKMNSVLGDHIGALNESVADNILWAWAATTAGMITRTTGSNYSAHLTGATLTRKGFTLSDLKRAKVMLDKQKVSAKNRFAVMTFDMWAQLEDELKATNAKDFSLYNDPKEGVIAKLYGFDIVTTTSTVVYDNAGTPALKAVGALGAATDNDAVLCYQKDCVELALGDIKFFEQTNHPQMYGDVYSGLVRMGGRKRYSDGTGIVSIIQAP
jgi:hypothetical protein